MYLLLPLLFLRALIYGQDDTPAPLLDPFGITEPATDVPEPNRFVGEFFYMLLMLGILISVVVFTSWLLKKMLNTKITQLNANSTIQIIERRALSNRTTLYLIDMEGKTMLIAETPTTVVPLFSEDSLQSSKEKG